MASSSCRIVASMVASGTPADRAGVKVGDVVVEVAGEKPAGLADLWRRIWRLGPSGTIVPLKVLRKSALVDLAVHSGDRNDFLKKPHLH